LLSNRYTRVQKLPGEAKNRLKRSLGQELGQRTAEK
jgi:hypothetical protein